MARSGARTWHVVTASPPREVFAVMEQLLGTLPYRFEPVDEHTARIVEVVRNGFFGNWRRVKRSPHWVTVRVHADKDGTAVDVEASSAYAAQTRALQLHQLLQRGISDRRTVYRDRHIPEGPVSLVASWAGTGYGLYLEPRYGAARGQVVHTATEMAATSDLVGQFIKVKTADGAEGYVERDQIVPAPPRATRANPVEVARFG